MSQPTVLLIIGIMTDDAITGRLLLYLTERVVANCTNQSLRLFGIGQGQFNSVQLPCQIVTETMEIIVGISLHQHFALRVESPACLQTDGLQQCITIRLGKWPVRAVRRLQKIPFLTQNSTRQTIVRKQARACRIVMANQLITLIMLSDVRSSIAQALDNMSLLCN